MFFLLSGEGATDLGQAREDVYEPGPMAILVSRIVESRHGYSPLDAGVCVYISKRQLAAKASEIKGGRKLGLPGAKRGTETRYFFNNARVLARIASEQAARRGDEVVAVLFRDADGTASSERGEWEAKRQSMINGFNMEGFTRGVPMIPNPKSEAWLICALKENPYQGCDALEGRSGNDDSPNSLKQELEAILATDDLGDWDSLRDRLNALVKDRIDFQRITMPSFTAFRERLEQMIDGHAPQAD